MRNENTKTNRILLLNRELETKKGSHKAQCRVRVEKDSKIEKYFITLSTSSDPNYKGVSVTNWYENFANEIKDSFLPEVKRNNIRWFENLNFNEIGADPVVREIDLDWKFLKQSYIVA